MSSQPKESQLTAFSSLVDESDRLVNAVYDLALDPHQFTSFTGAWDRFVENSQRCHDDTDEVNHQLNAAMARHFERAFLLMEKIGRDSARDFSVHDYVDKRSTPSIALGGGGEIVAMNSAALKLLKRKSPSVGNGELLHKLVHEDSVSLLNESFAKVKAGQKVIPVLVLLENRVPSLFVIKCIGDTNSFVVDMAGTMWSTGADQLLTSNYGLSSNECEIVAKLYQGYSAKRVAQLRQRSEETIRTQIRSILRKMNCESQVQLMRLITSLVFLSANDLDTSWFSDSLLMQKLALADGRFLDYYDVGKRGANVVVVFHGIMHTPELPEPILGALLAANLRVIGVCRAGYGHSTTPTCWSNSMEEGADDVRFLLSQLSIQKIQCIAVMGGSAYAYNFAARYPKMVDRIIAISGVVPYSDPDHIERLPASARALAKASKHFPKLLPLLVRSVVAIIDQGDIEKIISLAYRNSQADLTVAHQEPIFSQLKRSYSFTAHQGYAAYAYSGIAVTADHRDLLEEIECPIRLIHGVEDGVQHIDSVREFAKSKSNIELHELERVGQLAMFAKPNQLAKLLVKMLGHAHYQIAS